MSNLLNNLKAGYNDNKKVLSNFSYLTILQIFSLLFPFITYPYLIRILGLEKYGVIIFASTIVAYFSLFINFGFNTTGTRDVAFFINEKKKVSEIVSVVYINKFLLWLLGFVVYLLIINITISSSEDFLVYVFSYFLTFNELLFPSWFFQAIEKMRYITILNILVRLFFVFAIFIFIKHKEDYILVPIFNAMGAFLGGIIASYIVFKKEKVRFAFQPLSVCILYFKNAFAVFISSLSVQIYLYLNKIIVGTWLGMSQVAIYDLGEKIANLLRMPIMMISQATFPKISREKNLNYINKVMLLSTFIVILGYLIIFFTANYIVTFFLGEYIEEGIYIIRILSLSAIFASLNVYLGGNRMIPLGYEVLYSKISVMGLFFFILYFGIIWAVDSINYISISFNLIVVEICIFALLMYYNKKLNILR